MAAEPIVSDSEMKAAASTLYQANHAFLDATAQWRQTHDPADEAAVYTAQAAYVAAQQAYNATYKRWDAQRVAAFNAAYPWPRQ